MANKRFDEKSFYTNLDKARKEDFPRKELAARRLKYKENRYVSVLCEIKNEEDYDTLERKKGGWTIDQAIAFYVSRIKWREARLRKEKKELGIK